MSSTLQLYLKLSSPKIPPESDLWKWLLVSLVFTRFDVLRVQNVEFLNLPTVR